MNFIDRIDLVLKERNLKRAVLCDAVGINITSITAWKNRGTIPAGDVCLRIADYLGVSVEWLVTGNERGLSGEERQIISMYNKLDHTQKAMIRNVLQSSAPESK